MSTDPTDLHKASVSARLCITEAIWDDIAASNEPIVLQPWQRAEAFKADPSVVLIVKSFGDGQITESL